MASVGTIQQLASTLSNLGPELSSAAPSGAFGAVLSQVNSELAAASGATTDESADQSAAGGVATSSLLSGASGSTGSVSGSDVVADAQ